MITLDFETEAIDGNPITHPPKPVGLAVKVNDEPAQYFIGVAMAVAVGNAFAGEDDLLFHNAPFDISVAVHHFCVEWPHWSRVHDTQYLLFLNAPHSPSLGLKKSGEHVLGVPPEEQDDLYDWIMEHTACTSRKHAGAWISHAPHDLVARYAKQDVELTYRLYDYLIDKVPRGAYDVERELMPYFCAATRKGVRVDRPAMHIALKNCVRSLGAVEHAIRATLNDPTLNIDSGHDLAGALDREGKVTTWSTTPTGRRSVAKSALMESIDDQVLLNLLLYRSALEKVIGTYLRPWLTDSSTDSRLHPNWNQTRSSREKDRGTRTGRLSSDSPNFQNIPKPYRGPVPEGLCAIPEMRRFVLPEDGHEWVSADFSAQEMRILAHFENGALMKAFQADADLDPHSLIQGLIKEKTGRELKRTHVKNIGFGIMYGMGISSLATTMGVDRNSAQEMVNSYHMALPGVSMMQKGTKQSGREGHPIVTTGGREYMAEAPRIMNGEYRSFEYKLLNYLIQGSAADQTKGSLLSWFRSHPDDHVFMCTVHDEINISVPQGGSHEALERAMTTTTLDVPMTCTVERGPTWGEIK